MTTPPEQPEPGAPLPEAAKPPADNSGTTADLVAVGIGCAVFIVMLIAIILVGVSGR